MEQPLVTVIVPVYNSEKYLDTCIDSILGQTYKNLEIILVNDGSTDNSSQLCKSYVKKNEKIKLIEKINGGLSSARNAGIDEANGDYLTFIDSDDIVNNDMIEIMVREALKFEADIVKIGLKRIYAGDECVATYGEVECVSSYEAMRRIFEPLSKIITICGKLFSKKMFFDVRFPNGLFYEDEYTTPKLFNIANKVVICHSELYFYMQRDNDSIIRGRLTSKKIKDSLYIERERIDFFEEKKYLKLKKLAVYDYYYKLRKLYLELKDLEELSNEKKAIYNGIQEFRKKHILVYINIVCKKTLYDTKQAIMKILKRF